MLLDFFCIFSTGGLILWIKQYVNCKFESYINYLIKTILLDDKRTIDSLSMNGTILRWKISDEFKLVFLVAYQEAYSLLYVDKLLSSITNDFTKNEIKNLNYNKINNLYSDSYDYSKRFSVLLENWENDCNRMLEGGVENKSRKNYKSEPKKKQVNENTELNKVNSADVNETKSKINNSISVEKNQINNYSSNIPKNIMMKKNKSIKEEKVEVSKDSLKKKPTKEKTQKRGIGEYSEEMAKQLDM